VTSAWRWLVLLLGTALLLALPAAVRALPAPTATVTAAALLDRIQHSTSVGYSGYAETDGGLDLPVTNQFSNLTDLFGGHTQLRVWWRSAQDWRVDSIGFTGETDLHMTGQGWWTWNYESNSATFSEQLVNPRIRLPNDSDLLPPQLARRLLSQVRAEEVSRIAARRIAGENAPGLRVRPNQPDSTVDHIDVWADDRTGLPLRVAVFGRNRSAAALSSSFLDVDLNLPAASTTAFELPAGASVRSGAPPDLATTLDTLGGGPLPPVLAGIGRNPELPTLGAVAVYGRGVTEFAVVPLPRRIAFALHNQLEPAATPLSKPQLNDPGAITLSSGPLTLLLTSFGAPNGPWLLVGTVTEKVLAAASAALPGWTGR